MIQNAQIGRQQKVVNTSEDDDNAFRHAFLIIEAKKPGGTAPSRHVLCAESDIERDSWVDALVLNVASQTYDESGSVQVGGGGEPPSYAPNLTLNTNTSSTNNSNSNVSSHHVHHSSSTNSFSNSPTATEARRYITKDQIGRPMSTLPPASPDTLPGTDIPNSQNVARTIMAGQYPSSDSIGLSSSLPDSVNPLSAVNPNAALLGMPRANSEMGHYSDIDGAYGAHSRTSTSSNGPGGAGGLRVPQRNSYHPNLASVKQGVGVSPTDTIASESSPISAAPSISSNATASSKTKTISGPLNGTPIPPGYNFGGGKDAPADTNGGASGSGAAGGSGEQKVDRDRKTKSTHFWPFGSSGNHHGSSSSKTHASDAKTTSSGGPRAVFGVPITDALAVSQIANLPSVVFRCIQYLETKHAENEEGIYRLSGSSAVIKSLKDRFNTGACFSLQFLSWPCSLILDRC